MILKSQRRRKSPKRVWKSTEHLACLKRQSTLHSRYITSHWVVIISHSVPQQFDLTLARDIANQSGDGGGYDSTPDDSRRKGLWLRIARYAVEKDEDIKKYVYTLKCV